LTHWSKAVGGGGGGADAAGVAVWAWVMADVAANATDADDHKNDSSM